MWGDGGTYGAWSSYLRTWSKALGTPDGSRLPAVAPADFTPETWVRLTDQIVDALNARLRLWSDAVSTDVSAATSEIAAGRALVHGRVGIGAVLGLADHPSLPADLRAQLRALVEQQIRSMQRSLEDQLDRLGRQGATRDQVEQRRRTFRDNALTAVLSAGPAASAVPAGVDAWAAADVTAPRRRRLAVD